jgi:hypothetical protein
MDLLAEIRDEDLREKANGLKGRPGYITLVEMLAKTQRERDEVARKSPSSAVDRRPDVKSKKPPLKKTIAITFTAYWPSAAYHTGSRRMELVNICENTAAARWWSRPVF